MIRLALTSEDILKCLVVRGIVFIEEQEVDWEGEIDEFENTSTHILGEVDGQPVAAGRLRFIDGWAKLERVAVRPKWRGQGLARDIIAFLMAEADRQGAKKFKLHAQVYLKDLYEQFGFHQEGDVFDECGIPHILMLREES